MLIVMLTDCSIECSVGLNIHVSMLCFSFLTSGGSFCSLVFLQDVVVLITDASGAHDHR